MQFLEILLNGLMTGALYGLMAMGLAQIYGVSRMVNFAHGEMIVFCMYGFIVGYTLGIPLILLLLLIPLIASIFGFLLQKHLINPLHEKNEHAQFVAMAAFAVILSNGQTLLFGEHAQSLNWKISFLQFYNLDPTKLMVSILTMLTVIITHYFLKYHPWGLMMRAVADAPKGAEIIGINVGRIKAMSVALGMLLMSITGFFLLLFMDASPHVGGQLTLLSFVIVIAGGLGHMMGAFVAGLCIGCVESFTAFYLNPSMKTLASFGVLILVLIFRPQGIMGRLATGGDR